MNKSTFFNDIDVLLFFWLQTRGCLLGLGRVKTKQELVKW